jgi:FemAB-related protein (PEP-CTERM system-associated)
VTTLAAAAARDIRIVSDAAPERWDSYVQAHPDGTGYHLSAWRGVIERAFGHRTCYLAAEEGGRVAGVLPLVLFRSRVFGRFAVSMPFLNYGGIVADDDEVADALLRAGIEEARKAGSRSLELRHTRRLCPALRPKEHKVAMRLRLCETAEAQWNALDRKVRNQVRKADKSNLSVVRGGEHLLGDFYDVFAHNMRDLGTPVYSQRFFEEVFRAFPDRAKIVCVRHEGRSVAASVVFRHRTAMEVPWASSLREFNHLSPNVRLYWEMLQLAIDDGCRTFDFGRSTPNEGTYNFKKQWGAEPVPLVWEYWTAPGTALPDLSPKNAKYGTAISVWRKLPVGLTRLIGPPIVRNIP